MDTVRVAEELRLCPWNIGVESNSTVGTRSGIRKFSELVMQNLQKKIFSFDIWLVHY